MTDERPTFAPAARLTALAGAVARIVGEDAAAGGALSASIVSASDARFVARVNVAGRQVCAKVFDTGDRAAAAACERELSVLSALDGLRLAPSLLGSARAEGLIVLDWVAGPTLTRHMVDADPVELAAKLGEWLARFSRAMPGEDYADDWFAYLDKYAGISFGAADKAETSFLKALPITRRVIAKNDAHAGNFIVSFGDLVGVDYEAAALKPVWWDLLMTARELTRRRPDRIDRALPALAAGWRKIMPDDDQKTLERLMMIFIGKTLDGKPDTGPAGR